jgi:type IV pilus assembly protein PilY1
MRRLVAAQVLGVFAAATLVPPSVRAAPTPLPTTLAQVPQFLQSPPPPNVFITVDNSGSMEAEILPDDNTVPQRMFPMPLRTPYRTSGDGQPDTNLTGNMRFTGFGHNINVARLRSSAHNLIYYDPRLRYRPWKKADNAGVISSYDNAANVAFYNPFLTARGGLDLTASSINLGNYTVLEDTLITVNSGSSTYTARYTYNDTNTPTSPFALYYIFDTTRANCDTSSPTASRNDIDCYKRVEITAGNAPFTIPAGNQRGINEPGCTDATGQMVCSYAAEFQNFANWFQYYRARTLLARGAMGNAVADLGSGFRIGLGLLNHTDNSTNDADNFTLPGGGHSETVRLGVRDFTGDNRKPWFDLLQNHDVGSITPSGRALMEVGEYFNWKESNGSPARRGPWSDDPRNGSSQAAACRQSYHVYSTDGYWNENATNLFNGIAANARNADKLISPPAADPPICRDGVVPDGQPTCYRYNPSDTGQLSGPLFTTFGSPGPNNLGNPNNRRFGSSEQQTLADIAMYFWYRDLQPGMQNLISPSTANPAFWQNLSVLAVALGFTGTVTDQDEAFLTKLDTAAIDPATGNPYVWPQRGLVGGAEREPNGQLPETADDLWHAAVNSRGRLLIANNPQELAAQLQAALNEIRSRSAIGAAAASSTAFLDTGNGIFTAEMAQGSWSGNIYRREIDPVTLQFKVTGKRDANGVPYVWRASDLLPADTDQRKIFTMVTGNSARESIVAFKANNPSGSGVNAGVDATQMTDLAGPAGQSATDVINYLRGVRTKELSAIPAGTLRDRPRRTSVVGSLDNPFGTFADSAPIYVRDEDFNYDFLPTGTPGRDTYLAYLRANQGTSPTTGRAATLWAGSNDGMFHAFDAQTGNELFAYVPRAVIPNLSLLVDPKYTHRFTVDGIPSLGDAFIRGPGASGAASWRTVVLSSLGAGGRAVFAIDATAPGSLNENSVYWELNERTVELTSPSGQATRNANLLGSTFGPVFTARTAADGGKWVAVFANGPESNLKRAALFVVDLETGAIISVLDTGVGDDNNPNGLSTPAPLFDANRQLVAVYAGDLRGNVWKFDLSNANSANWNVAFNTTPLFTTRSPDGVGPSGTRGQPQPIFSKPLLRVHPNGGIMVLFGTGKLIAPGDRESENVQSFYGVWDKPGETVGLTANFRASGGKLVQQAITDKSGNPTLYFMTNKGVDYGVSGMRGWFFDLGVTYNVNANGDVTTNGTLVTPRERMILAPLAFGQNMLAQSFVPSVDSCDLAGLSFLFRLRFLDGNFIGTGSFGNPNSAAISMPGSFGLLPLLDRPAEGQDPSNRTGVVFGIGLLGDLTGRRIDLGGLGAFRTWRQLLD